jgi:hypothetical protein
MAKVPGEIYGNLMQVVRRRLDTIRILQNVQDDEFSRAESAAFQGRKGQSIYDKTARALEAEARPGSPTYALLAKKFGDVTLIVYFNDRTSLRDRTANFGDLITWLITTALARKTIPDALPLPVHFRCLIDRIRVEQTPKFKLTASEIVSAFGAETLRILRGKLTRRYRTEHPVELLAHSFLKPWTSNVGFEKQIAELIQEQLQGSPFERAWIVDVQNGMAPLKFVWPPPPYDLRPWPLPWQL